MPAATTPSEMNGTSVLNPSATGVGHVATSSTPAPYLAARVPKGLHDCSACRIAKRASKPRPPISPCSTMALTITARIAASPASMAISHRSASRARIIAGLSGFLILSQSRDGPDRSGALSRFDTRPSRPSSARPACDFMVVTPRMKIGRGRRRSRRSAGAKPSSAGDRGSRRGRTAPLHLGALWEGNFRILLALNGGSVLQRETRRGEQSRRNK
jgi:hypothetical protein